MKETVKDHTVAVPEDLLCCFRVLKKCKDKFDCLVNEMLYIKLLRLALNMQMDSISAKVLVWLFSFKQIYSILTPFELAFLFLFLDDGVMMSPKCQNIVPLLYRTIIIVSIILFTKTVLFLAC